MKPVPLDSDDWCERCAKRLAELDRNLSQDEADEVAEDVYAFERTRAMAPETAADFVATEMARPDRSRFERRGADRPARRPVLRSILRLLATPRARHPQA
ncbi:MAG: hypothetical protein ACXWCV_17810 [Caldimonas sp.]